MAQASTEPGPELNAEAVVPILTIGHSTRSIGEFVNLLKLNGVRRVIDVRSSPTSRRWPHFNQVPLAHVLEANGIAYSHIVELGGRRKRATASTLNLGWSEPSFRNYADYMQTSDFARGMELLVQVAQRERVAIMCSEAVWWRCHRRLITDALLVRGVDVKHILSEHAPEPARLTPFAIVDGTSITYPAPVGADSHSPER